MSDLNHYNEAMLLVAGLRVNGRDSDRTVRVIQATASLALVHAVLAVVERMDRDAAPAECPHDVTTRLSRVVPGTHTMASVVLCVRCGAEIDDPPEVGP